MKIKSIREITIDGDGFANGPLMPLALLSGREGYIAFYQKEFENDPNQADFEAAFANIQKLTAGEFKTMASRFLLQYYIETGGNTNILPEKLWDKLEFKPELFICRRQIGEQAVYVQVQAKCKWLPVLHPGVCFVLKVGKELTRFSSYDGYLTNSDAYGRPDLEGFVYVQGMNRDLK